MSIERIDARLAIWQVQPIGQGVVEIQQPQPHDLPGRQIKRGRMCAIHRRQHARRTATGRLARHAEFGERPLLVDMPAFQVERALVPETAWFALLDNQRTDQPATQLRGTAGVRVIPEAAGIVQLEAIVEELAG